MTENLLENLYKAGAGYLLKNPPGFSENDAQLVRHR